MKIIFSILCLLLDITAFAQKPDDLLATATGHTFKASDLSPEAQNARVKLPALIVEVRKQLLSQTLGNILLETEAKGRNTTVPALIKIATVNIKDPTAAEIQAVYDANQAAIAGRPLTEVRKQIVEFLRRDPEEKVMKTYVDTLAAKYKVVYGKDVNAIDLKPADIVFSMTGRTFSAKEFEDVNRLTLYDTVATFYDDLRAELEKKTSDTLLIDEAKAQKIEPGDLIAREITGKMKDYTEAESEGLELAFRTRLFTKYAVKILLKDPPPPIQNISVGDGPSRGPTIAPVTVVMFSDFQCSACSATHPILKDVLAGYGDKVHFVVRNFPLESLHENAYRAALAAGAANAQGKFFEYTEVLYKNQTALDYASLKKYAADLGLNAAQFAIDFNSEKTAAVVRRDLAEGKNYGITGTPSIFVNGIYVRHFSAENFKKLIDAALKK